MLAELAAINAAFSVIKTTVSHGRDLAGCAKQIGDIVQGEEILRRKVERKKSSPWAKLAGKQASEFEEFMALEKIKQQKEELESAIKIYGRAGMWDAWQKYLTESRKSRRMAELQRKQMIEDIKHGVAVAFGCIFLIGGVAAIIYMAIWLRNK